ncbi:MAG: hypothetical protein AAF533_06320 [Acidobacteriota bacterium]
MRVLLAALLVSTMVVTDLSHARPGSGATGSTLRIDFGPSFRLVDDAATLEPAVLGFEGDACSCFEATSVATLPETVVRADVLLAMDLTGSMVDERDLLIEHVLTIVEELEDFIPDVAFGVASYQDYPTEISVEEPCPLEAIYGDPDDYPFRLHQPITSDDARVVAAVETLPEAQGGMDAPESYNRLFLEAHDNPLIGWRPGARHLLVNFGDSVPHDCNVQECLGTTSPLVRGVDLGRDGLPETGDELITLEQVDALAENDIVLIHFDSSGGRLDADIGTVTYEDIWSCWASRTGGFVVGLNRDGSSPDGRSFPELIASVVGEVTNLCGRLSLRASDGFEDWLDDPGPLHEDVVGPASRDFPFRLCVPEDTPLGRHELELLLDCDGGTVARQTVVVDVIESDDCCGVDCAELDLGGHAAGDEVVSLPGITIEGSEPVVVFDTGAATCDDEDLATPGMGNVENLGLALVLQEPGSDCRPDDSRHGGTLRLVFDEPVEIDEVLLIDIDEPGTVVIARSSEDEVLDSVEVAALHDNNVQRVPLGHCGIAELEVVFGGSGALGGLGCLDGSELRHLPRLRLHGGLRP